MRVPNPYSQRSTLRFNITPLIDVVFLLIIFFLVASHFVRNEQAAPVTLPVSGRGTADHAVAPYRLTITVASDGTLFLGNQPQSQPALVQQLTALREQALQAGATPEVRIRADRDAAYGQIRRLIEECAALNLRSLRFAVMVEH